MKEKILITGGLGNLGSWITQAFVEADYQVYVLSKSEREVLTDLHFEFIKCDITNAADCLQKLEGLDFEYVIHAASANDNFEPDYYQTALKTNTLGTRNLLEALNIQAIKHFVYLSTFHVYGVSSGTITEATPLAPKNDYASTHLFAEYYVKQFFYSHKLPFTIIRLTNSYGCPKEYNSSKWYLVMNDLARLAFEEKKIVLKSNGRVLRDFIWMGTVAAVMLKLIKLEQAPNEEFNLSGESSWRMIQIAEQVQQVYEEEYNTHIPIETNLKDTNPHNYTFLVSSQKLKKIISFEANDHFKKEIKAVFNLLEQNTILSKA